MADQGHNPDSEAKKWFVLAVIGTVLYVSAAFKFVILADVGPQEVPEAVSAQEGEHGQPD
jgi:hypothetical protein